MVTPDVVPSILTVPILCGLLELLVLFHTIAADITSPVAISESKVVETLPLKLIFLSWSWLILKNFTEPFSTSKSILELVFDVSTPLPVELVSIVDSKILFLFKSNIPPNCGVVSSYTIFITVSTETKP